LYAYHKAKLLKLTRLDSNEISQYTGIPVGTLWNRSRGFQDQVALLEDKFIKQAIARFIEKAEKYGASYADIFKDASGYSDELAEKLVERLLKAMNGKAQAGWPIFLSLLSGIDQVILLKKDVFDIEQRKKWALMITKIRTDYLSVLVDKIAKNEKGYMSNEKAAKRLKEAQAALGPSVVAYF
jgi:hypothetical protein